MIEEGNNPLVVSLVALWDDEIGPKIIDLYPNSNIGDPERLVIHVFTIYQFFWDQPGSEFQRSNLTIPIAKLNKIALALFDIIPNPKIRGGFQPFIVVFLVPEYITEEQSKIYKEIQMKISQDFLRNQNFSLKEYYQEIKNSLIITESFKEPIREIDEYYSYTAAMEDFKAGIKLFQTKNFEQAYSLLTKVLLKFEQENHKHLIMEVLYLIGSLLTQQKKFNEAEQYFDQLEGYAEDLNHEKYLELSIFMKGFFEYKMENYASARRKMEQINISKSKYINKMQYYTIYGKILQYYENDEEALQNLSKALEISNTLIKSDKVKKERSQILYEMGVIQYKIAVNSINNLGLTKVNAISPILKEAINYFLQSAEISIELNEIEKLTSIYQLIGNLYETLGEDNKFIEFYTKAIDYADKEKLVEKKVRLLRRIIQKQIRLKNYEENINLLRNFFNQEDNLRFIDLHTISILHWQLANSLLSMGKKYEGISELMKSYELFKNFKVPVDEEIEILTEIIKFYEEMEDYEKVSFYQEKFNELSKSVDNYYKKDYCNYNPLAPIKEIWIYSTSTGVGLYNYSPETKVDIDLLGGLMIALQQFSVQISQEELQVMDIGEDRYLIHKEKEYDFFILGRSNLKTPIEIIEKILSKIYRRFWKEYSQEIKYFRGNVSIFRGFTKIIENLDLTLIR
ncbi:MAG: hypothetical protein EU532_06815 [Promethearchaeota archaeon]|nr:MAG: hypothetical protein EU532_06815 [Candidatus Lokiarchaeota archaeon]